MVLYKTPNCTLACWPHFSDSLALPLLVNDTFENLLCNSHDTKSCTARQQIFQSKVVWELTTCDNIVVVWSLVSGTTEESVSFQEPFREAHPVPNKESAAAGQSLSVHRICAFPFDLILLNSRSNASAAEATRPWFSHVFSPQFSCVTCKCLLHRVWRACLHPADTSGCERGEIWDYDIVTPSCKL